jgi:hypothetical protein
MNTTHNTKTKRLIAAWGVAAAAAVAPALLFAGAGTAHADCFAPRLCTIDPDDRGGVPAADPGGSVGGVSPQPPASWGRQPAQPPLNFRYDPCPTSKASFNDC